MRPDELYKTRRSSRTNSAVTCLSFGPDRKTIYAGYFFCHGCDLFEDAILNGNKRASQDQRKYRCTGGHGSGDGSHPTTLIHEYRYRSSSQKERHSGSSNTKISSPTKSPLKKKHRQQQELLQSFASSVASSTGMCSARTTRRVMLGNCSDDDEDDSGGDGGEEQDYVIIGRRLFRAMSFNDVSGNDQQNDKQQQEEGRTSPSAGKDDNRPDSDDDDVMVYIKDLEERNCYLVDVEQRLSDKVATLEAEIVKLKEQTKIIRGTTYDSCSPAAGRELGATVDEFENSTKRKQRVDRENAQVSEVLSNLIHSFLTNSDLTADKRRFPTRRLAKIIMDSVLSFQWAHNQVAVSALTLDCSMIEDGSDGRRRYDDQLFASSLLTFVNEKLRNFGNKTKAAILVKSLWNDSFLEGEAQSCMIDRVRSHMRCNVFTPSKILKAMDLAGFNLSLAGIEVLRSVDTADKKYCRGFLPSKTSILRAARRVESNADARCPFKMIGRNFGDGNSSSSAENNHAAPNFGEGFEFDVIKTTRTLFDAFGLMADAKRRSVELSLASDGAQLTHTISHVTAGLKFNDMGMRDPVTKCPLLLHRPDSLVQSRNLCFPLRVVIAKDNKETLDGFRALYQMFNTDEVSNSLQCLPMKMSYPGDMKLQWGALDNGGAAKVKEKFCYICPCRSSTLHVPQDKSKCRICLDNREEDPNRHNNEDEHLKQCYHYEFLASPEVRGELMQELDIVTAMIEGDLWRMEGDNNICGQQQQHTMYVRQSGNPAIEGDMLDIDFQPTTMGDTATFSRQITDELASRSMDITGPLQSRRQRLREQLVNEQRVREIQRMLVESEPRDKAMYLVLQAVVCILHLENRVGLKSIESVLRSGLSNAVHDKLEWIQSNAVKKRQNEFIECVTNIIQTRILGTFAAPSQWRFPLAEDGTMGSLSMDNNRTRSIINELELIIDVSFPDSDVNKGRLLRCFPRYRAAIIILRKNSDYTEDEVKMFQKHIDAWFCDWVSVYGKEGCTNYTHMLSSSHVMRYMQEWKCLHRYSQQGWEALNALIKAYFFRRTNRGGLAKNAAKKSKLLGIARWLQRRMMWYSGHGDALFVDNQDDSSDSSYDDDDNSTASDDDDESATNNSYTSSSSAAESESYYSSANDDNEES